MKLTSNDQPVEEMQAALVAGGYAVTEDPPAEPAEVRTEPSVPAGEPGEKKPEDPAGEAPVETEEPGEKSQEEPKEPEPKAEPPAKSEGKTAAKTKGGYQAKVDDLTKRLDTAREIADSATSGKAKAEARVAELEAELAKLKPKEPEKPPELKRPERPVMPDLADFEYDTAKFQDAMKKYRSVDLPAYETAMDQYQAEKTQRTIDNALATERTRQAQVALEAEQRRVAAEFDARIVEGAKAYGEEWTPTLEAAQEEYKELPDIIRGYFMESENPADIMFHLAANPEDLQRCVSLVQQPYKLLQEMTRLEMKATLAREGRTKADPAAAEPKPAKAAEEPPPAKEPPPKIKTLEKPITPVGSRATASKGPTDEELAERAAQGDKEAQRLFRQRVVTGMVKKQAS